MKKDEVIRRLVFIKYLYTLGVEQSKKPEPYSWASILTFHDAVELFLLLTTEHLDVAVKSLRGLVFSKYWEIVEPILQKKRKCGLTQKISMLKLNDARVNLKHHGTAPSADTIKSAKVNVANFLEENIDLIFGIKFADISMIDLV